MGIFDFAKEAGAKIGIGDSKEEKAAAAASADAAKEARQRMAKRRAAAIERRKTMAASAEAKAKAEAEDKAAAKKAMDAEGRRSDSIERRLAAMDLGAYNVKVDGDTATIVGEAPTQEIREKTILAVGNVYGIATVREFISVADDSVESDMYTVQAGDYLSKIAKEVYGDAMKYPVIFEANKPMLTDPDLIYPGQVLRIPAL